MTENHVERFHAEVKKGLPIILCMHCPFSTPELARASCKYWQFNRKFRQDNPGPMNSYQTNDGASCAIFPSPCEGIWYNYTNSRSMRRLTLDEMERRWK